MPVSWSLDYNCAVHYEITNCKVHDSLIQSPDQVPDHYTEMTQLVIEPSDQVQKEKKCTRVHEVAEQTVLLESNSK